MHIAKYPAFMMFIVGCAAVMAAKESWLALAAEVLIVAGAEFGLRSLNQGNN